MSGNVRHPSQRMRILCEFYTKPIGVKAAQKTSGPAKRQKNGRSGLLLLRRLVQDIA